MTELIAHPKPLLPIGSTAVRRDVFQDRIWTESPTRVLRADGVSVTAAIWPGVTTLSSKDLIASRVAAAAEAEALRLSALDALADGSFELSDWVWHPHCFVTDVIDGQWFTVTRMYAEAGADTGAGSLVCWYVNFERPPSWRANGWDTMDLAVDLVVDPDGCWHWKDEDEYAHSRRLGLITAAEHAAVARAREQAVDEVERRVGVFAEDPGVNWRPDPAWPLPALG